MTGTRKTKTIALALIPVGLVLWIWLSALAFVPVPWPDDSAFYFVGREFWQWPPRWVMLPQAPFEPTYRLYNFNTMPLFPILIGLGRFLGIDGSFALKFWPLSFYAATGSLLAVGLFRAGMPLLLAALLGAGLVLDPGARWAAVIIRPESLIGLCGVALVLGLSLGFPKRLQARGFWDPIAALLALAAYAHFNAIHLLFPVVLTLLGQRKRLVEIGQRTFLYLTPWVLTVALKPTLFIHQMRLQWGRLAHRNNWLESTQAAIFSLFQDMGSPEPWPASLHWLGGIGLWLLLFLALLFGLLLPLFRHLSAPHAANTSKVNLLPAGAWVLGACWLWDSKPEVWFIYYVHLSVWTFAGLALLQPWRKPARAALGVLVTSLTLLFTQVDIEQARRLAATKSWHWDTYRDFVQCVDERLAETEKRLGYPKPFRVWCPTFPDITVELSRKHPHWDLTRTNDFSQRVPLAMKHGHEVEAVVVTETLNWPERNISGPASQYPTIQSTWMNWRPYFLNQLYLEPGWKPNRSICQRGRWQAFLFEN